MRDGFIKVAAGTPKIRVADCRYNAEQIFTMMREADKQGVKVLCLPELCLTGYTCGDLFLQDTLLCGAEEGLQTILEATRNLDMVTVLGLPVRCKWDNKLYNCAAVIQSGEILGLVPKTYLPNYGEFYEERWFASGAGVETSVDLCGETVDMDAAGLFACETVPNLVLGVEICEDLWATEPPLRPAGPGRGYGDPEPVGLQRAGGQVWIPPQSGGGAVRAPGVRICVRRCWGRRVHHRPGVHRPQHDCRERCPAGGAALCHGAHHQRDRCGPAGL